MKILESLNALINKGRINEVFIHIRNYIICAFVLAIGTFELKQQNELLLGLVTSKLSGVAIVGLAVVLIILNLFDGIRKISKAKHHKILTTVLVLFYILMSISVVEMALNFKVSQAYL